ncbi:MAG TPA: hypothetical protein VGH27_18490 [Streptosporangiaceae bacterium]
MSELMLNLLGRLSSMPCHATECTLERMLADWREDIDTAIIRREIGNWLIRSDAADEVRMGARETSTHYVWPLYVASNGYALTINEFKDPRYMSLGYANVLHNHRYSFASLVLSGGYSQVRSRVEMHITGQAARIDDIAQDFAFEGRVLTINHGEFHRLTDIGDRTVTLLAKCPPVKRDSVSVNIKTLEVSRHVPVEARLFELMGALTTGEHAGRIEEKSHARIG